METAIDFEEKVEMILNDQQQEAFNAMLSYLKNDNPNEVFILRGSAGTGKTTLMRTLTKHLDSQDQTYFLLAPTGRAANILTNSTQHRAKTLHSFLYSIKEDDDEEITRMQFVTRMNFLTSATVLIVDESSMVSDMPAGNELFYSQNSLLNDLICFYNDSPKGSKMIFVGDQFQLPPVNENYSAALNPVILKKKYKVDSVSFALTEVIRQKSESYILQNAIMLRNLMLQHRSFESPLKFRNMYKPELAIANFCKLYDPEKPANAVFIAYKNSTVGKFNRMIRNKLYGNSEELLSKNEQVVLGKTTYKQTYLPSAETGKVISFDPDSFETIAEIKFAEATFQFSALTGETIEFKSKFDLDYLLSDCNTDTTERYKKLWAERKRTNPFFRESNNPLDDPYLSALNIKYGYAITAHKAQGGEWENVFLYPEFPSNENRLKWIYTAVTRAKCDLYSF